jgi:DtxR family Mn-dependent transcriptional regulator
MEENKTQLSESLEDYLEAILELERTQKVARVKDIADRLGVLRGSVSTAIKKLADLGLIHYEPYSFITLTSSGRKAASLISRRHKILLRFLRDVLKLDSEQAEQNACRMEHAMDDSTVDRLVQFIEYISTCPRTGEDWVDSFEEFLSEREKTQEDCLKCLEGCYKRLHEDSSGSGME